MMLEQKLHLNDIATELKEMTRYCAQYDFPELEACAQKWRSAFRRSYPLLNGESDPALTKELCTIYVQFRATYETRYQRFLKPRQTQRIPEAPLPVVTPKYRNFIESLGGLRGLRAVAISAL